jgi:hypothetical protein
MPAYTNEDGKIVVFFQDADLWPVAYALQKWSPAVEKQVVELVQSATS